MRKRKHYLGLLFQINRVILILKHHNLAINWCFSPGTRHHFNRNNSMLSLLTILCLISKISQTCLWKMWERRDPMEQINKILWVHSTSKKNKQGFKKLDSIWKKSMTQPKTLTLGFHNYTQICAKQGVLPLKMNRIIRKRKKRMMSSCNKLRHLNAIFLLSEKT